MPPRRTSQRTPGSPSAVHRTPAELLGKIFKHYINTPVSPAIDLARTFAASRFSMCNPIILSHVCRYWRHASLSIPTLWSSIYIQGPKEVHVPMVQLWLERAGNCPLSLALSEIPPVDVTQRAAIREILSLFIIKVHLWRHIDFSFRGRTPYEELLSLPTNAAVMLESINLDACSWGHYEDRVWHKFYRLPSLRQVHWDREYVPLDTPWAQLTHIFRLNAHSLELDEILEILHHCQQLVVLDLLPGMTLDFPMHATPVTIATLHVLSLFIFDNPEPLLNHLILPSLVSLEITRINDSSDITCIKGLLNRSGCRLDTLRLRDFMSKDDLCNLLTSPATQSLSTLDLGYSIDHNIVKLLTHMPGHAQLLPLLRPLKIGECRTSEGRVAALLTSRWPMLKTVHFTVTPQSRLTRVLKYLKAFQAVGHKYTIFVTDDSAPV